MLARISDSDVGDIGARRWPAEHTGDREVGDPGQARQAPAVRSRRSAAAAADCMRVVLPIPASPRRRTNRWLRRRSTTRSSSRARPISTLAAPAFLPLARADRSAVPEELARIGDYTPLRIDEGCSGTTGGPARWSGRRPERAAGSRVPPVPPPALLGRPASGTTEGITERVRDGSEHGDGHQDRGRRRSTSPLRPRRRCTGPPHASACADVGGGRGSSRRRSCCSSSWAAAEPPPREIETGRRAGPPKLGPPSGVVLLRSALQDHQALLGHLADRVVRALLACCRCRGRRRTASGRRGRSAPR